MGCIARLGCLLVLAVLAVGGWFTRDLWMPERFHTHSAAQAHATAPGWEPITNTGAERAKVALEKLSEPDRNPRGSISTSEYPAERTARSNRSRSAPFDHRATSVCDTSTRARSP